MNKFVNLRENLKLNLGKFKAKLMENIQLLKSKKVKLGVFGAFVVILGIALTFVYLNRNTYKASNVVYIGSSTNTNESTGNEGTLKKGTDGLLSLILPKKNKSVTPTPQQNQKQDSNTTSDSNQISDTLVDQNSDSAESDTSQSNSTNPTATPQPTQPKTVYVSPTAIPTSAPTPTNTPTPSPTPTTAEYSTMEVNMYPEGGYNPSASGKTYIKLAKQNSNNYNDYSVWGTYNNLTPNRTHKIWLCDSGGGCSTNNDLYITTDASGNVTFNATLTGHNDNYSLNSVKVWQDYTGEIPPSDPTICPFVSYSSNACLHGSY